MPHPAFVWVNTRSGYIQSIKQEKARCNFHKFCNIYFFFKPFLLAKLELFKVCRFIFHRFSYVHLWCLLIGVANRTGQASWCCAVRPASLVLLFDGIYCPKMKGANWLKLMCSQGKSQVNIFSLWNIWYKSVVPSLIWLHSSVCQIHNKCQN